MYIMPFVNRSVILKQQFFQQATFSIISCVLLYIGISISMTSLLTEEDSKHIKTF